MLVCVPLSEEARMGLVGWVLWGPQTWRRPIVFGALCAAAAAPPRTTSIEKKWLKDRRAGSGGVACVPVHCQTGYAAVAYVV